MNSFQFRDIKVEKANAILRYRRIQKITKIFRFLELLVFLIIISQFFTQFLFQFKISGDFVRRISIALISPRFVFVVGNAIVIILFFKSGKFSPKNGEISTDFYDEYVEKCRKTQQIYGEGNNTVHRKFHRSKSEKMETVVHKEDRCRELRRSATEKFRKSVDSSRKPTGKYYVEDEMSGDEFRQAVEAFIARQQRNLREEEKVSAMVSYGN